MFFAESERDCCIKSYQKWATGSNTEGTMLPWYPAHRYFMPNNTIKSSFWSLVALTSYSISSPRTVRRIIRFYPIKLIRQKAKHPSIYLELKLNINIIYNVKSNRKNNVKIKFQFWNLICATWKISLFPHFSHFYPFTIFCSRNPTAVFNLKCSNILLNEATAALSETSY